MSYILDALKKMEHEKERKSAPAGMTRISGDLFKEERPLPVKGNAWKLVVVALAASLVAVAGTWFFLASGKKGEHGAPRMAAHPEPARAVATAPPVSSPAPASPVAVPPPPVPAAPAVAAPSVPAVPRTSPVSIAPPVPIPSPESAQHRPRIRKVALPPVQARKSRLAKQPAVQPLKTTQKREADIRRKDQKVQPPPGVASRPAPVGLVAPPADITVSGIAWGDDRKARRAVVNGSLLREGSTVGGARVSEIHKDKVRFSKDGRNFEISMNAPGAPASVPASSKKTLD